MEDAGGGRRQQETAASKAQRGAVAAGVSVHEWLQHVKASFLGLVSNGWPAMESESGRVVSAPDRAASIIEGWFDDVVCAFNFQVRKVTARSEQEAAEADMLAAKAQVEATDEAEAKKKQLADH